MCILLTLGWSSNIAYSSPLPLSQTGQPCFLQLSVSIAEVLVANFLSGTPSCSTIFGLTKPLFCSLISSAICSHDDASVPFGVGGQKMGMRLVGFFSSFFVNQVSFFSSSNYSDFRFQTKDCCNVCRLMLF